MKKKKNFHVKSRHMLVVLTFVCVAALMLTGTKLVSVGPVRNIFGALIVPLQSGINKAGTKLTDLQSGFQDVQELAKENASLKEQVADLQEENMVLSGETKELKDLQDLYDLDQSYASYDKVAADVVAKNDGSLFSSFTINKGSDDGITVDMNVISDGGLVGLVTSVGKNWANVRSIIDDNNNISAMLLTTSETCIVSSEQSLAEEGKLSLSQLSRDAEPVAGEKIVTSNISDKYLEGILIGYVDSTKMDSNHLTQNGYLTPAVDFQQIRHVLVILQTKNNPDTSTADSDTASGGES